ncbi:MAG: hypothetical protein DI626_12040, partial [Micavibrio aeruginosavorus]
MTPHKNIPARVWIAETGNYDPSFLLDFCADYLSKEENKRAGGITNQESKINFLIARYLLRMALTETDPQVNPKDWLIENGEFGKPYLKRGQSSKDIRFNLSHTKGFVCCLVIEDYECGVDIQSRNIGMDWEDISREILSKEEYESLESIDNSLEQEKRFYQYWVMKESLLKGMGVGLLDSMREHSFIFSADIDQQTNVTYKNCPLQWEGQVIDVSTDC